MRLSRIALVFGCMLIGYTGCGNPMKGEPLCTICVEAVPPDPDIPGSGRDSTLTSPPPPRWKRGTRA
jgi:hypothetical protein